MESVSISPKYQVVIPRRVREAMHLSPGQRVQVVQYGSRIELVPLKKLSELRGLARGIDTRIEREPDRV